MKRRALIFLVAALLVVPLYLVLDSAGALPLALRDRPWPLALVSLALVAAAWRRAPALALAVAITSLGWLAYASHARYRLPPSSPGAGVGAPLPDVTVADEAGRPFALRDLRGRPTLFVWFRGAWCPYCRQQLADLAAEIARHGDGGVRLVALAADPPPPLAELKRKLALPFSLLSDPELRVANQCRMAHCVAILDGNGVVRWEVVSGNWEKDLPARALIQAAYRQR